MRVEVRNAADPKQVKQAGKKLKSREEVEAEDLRAVLRTPVGRRFLYRVLERTGFFRSSFKTSAEMAFLEGERNVGLWLHSEIGQVDPRAFLQMLGEKIENEGD